MRERERERERESVSRQIGERKMKTAEKTERASERESD